MRQRVTFLLLVASACGPQSQDSTEKRQTPVVRVELAFERPGTGEDQKALIAHGEKLSWVLGCRGCHGKNLTGESLTEGQPGYGIFYAPNLTLAMPSYGDAQFERLLRAGEHPRRSAMWIMPSEIYQHLGHSDLHALRAYLRSLAPAGEPSPLPQLGPLALEEIKNGKVKPAAQIVKEARNEAPIDLGSVHEWGRYIAMVTCAECHGTKLEGRDKRPDLIVVGAYSGEEFEALLTKGVPNGPRKLRQMAGVAQSRYSRMTRAERDALYTYLKARAERPQ